MSGKEMFCTKIFSRYDNIEEVFDAGGIVVEDDKLSKRRELWKRKKIFKGDWNDIRDKLVSELFSARKACIFLFISLVF